jgi:subtilisin-like proprotein convertase family protein
MAPVSKTGNQTFTNSSGITINDTAKATPYPSTISVSGFTGSISDVNVSLTGFSHTWKGDVDVLLESPSGQRVILLSDCGEAGSGTSINLILNDSAASNLPASTALVSGSFKPTNRVSPDNFAAPGPGSFAAPIDASSNPLSTFNGFDPNGTWKLYVVDDAPGDVGSIASWSLAIIAPVPIDSSVITGSSSVCSGDDSIVYSIPAVAGVTGYSWQVPAGAVVAAGANTNSIKVNFPGSAVAGNIRVTPFNSCGNGTPSQPFPVIVNTCSMTLNLKIFIEGYYNGNGSMVAVADPSGHPSLCDTITIELRDPVPPYDVVESIAGTIDTGGNGSFLLFSLSAGNSYYIVVRHRNSIETWSKTAVVFNAANVTYDFTRP